MAVGTEKLVYLPPIETCVTRERCARCGLWYRRRLLTRPICDLCRRGEIYPLAGAPTRQPHE